MVDKKQELLSVQESEEKARLMALKRGYALVRRDVNRVYRIHGDGYEKLLCTVTDPHDLWFAAIECIEEQDSKIQAAPAWMRFSFSVIHNVFIHPIMPFTWGSVGRFVDGLHDFTGTVAFTLPPEQRNNGVTNE